MKASSTRAIQPRGFTWAVAVWAAVAATPAVAGIGSPIAGAGTAVDGGFDDPKLMREGLAPRAAPVGASGVARVGSASPISPLSPPALASATQTRAVSPSRISAVPPPAAAVMVPPGRAPRTEIAPPPPGPLPPSQPPLVAKPAPALPRPAPAATPKPAAAPVAGAAAAKPAPAAIAAVAKPPAVAQPVALDRSVPPAPRRGETAPQRGREIAAAPPAKVAPAPRLALADTTPVDASASATVATARRPEEAPPVAQESASAPWPYAPRMKLAYRRFPFPRAASAAPSITPGALDPNRPESLETVSLDFYPVSWYLRMGLSTQFGWESGQFDRSGDYFVAESVSLGLQLPGRITPFVEGLAGAGYMRRMQATGAMPSAYWQVGVDAGVEVYFAARAYVSVALGYLHPGNLFLMDQNLQSVKLDTWSLKVGLGI